MTEQTTLCSQLQNKGQFCGNCDPTHTTWTFLLNVQYILELHSIHGKYKPHL